MSVFEAEPLTDHDRELQHVDRAAIAAAWTATNAAYHASLAEVADERRDNGNVNKALCVSLHLKDAADHLDMVLTAIDSKVAA